MPQLAVFPKAWMDQLCVDGTMSLPEWIDMAARLDVDGLELYTGILDLKDRTRLPEMRRRAEDRGLTIPMMCASPDFTHPEAAFRAEQIDRQVNTVIVEAQARAAKILADHKDELVRLRDELLEKKTLEPDRVNAIITEVRQRYASEVSEAREHPPVPAAVTDDRTPLDGPTPAARHTRPAETEE